MDFMSTSNNRFVRSEEGSNCSNRQSRLQQLGWERKKERRKSAQENLLICQIGKELRKTNHWLCCVHDHSTQYHQKHASYSFEVSFALPTRGGYITASGIITLDLFPRETGVYEFRHHDKLARTQLKTNKQAHTETHRHLSHSWCKLKLR